MMFTSKERGRFPRIVERTPANRVLQEFRADLRQFRSAYGGRGDDALVIGSWLDCMSEEGEGEGWLWVLREATPQEFRHARRVLLRLAALKGVPEFAE